MKQSSNIKSYILILAMCGLTYAPTASAAYFRSLDYYMGVSAGYQNVAFRPGFGQNLIPQHTLDYEIFAGGRHLHKFGFEFGMSFTPETNKYITLYGGDYYPGAVIPLEQGTWQTWNTTYKNANFYLGVNRYLSFTKDNRFRAFMFVGLAYAEIKSVFNFIDDDLPGTPDQAEQDAARDTFEDVGIIPMFKVGVEYDFTPRFGCRAAYTWKNYAAFGKIYTTENPGFSFAIMPKNTNAVYLSLFLTF